jgi:hypothetical protein
VGVIDEATHTLTCACGATESVKILQHGSAYGGSWQAGKPFSQFTVTWGKEGPVGPTISSAKCNSCGAAPDVVIS